MTFVPAANTAKCTIKGTLYGQDCLNMVWIKNSIPWTNTLLDDLNNALETWWEAVIVNLSQDYHFVQVTSADQTTQNGLERTKNFDHAAGEAQVAHPGNVALVVTLLTGQRGRSYRGRTYIPAIPHTQAVTGDLNAVLSTFLTALLTDYAGLDAAIAGISGIPVQVVASLRTAGAPRIAAVLSTVLDYAIDAYLDSQRRRLHGRGK